MGKRPKWFAVAIAFVLLPKVWARNPGEATATAREESAPQFVLIQPTPEYNTRLKAMRDSHLDYIWNELESRNEEPTYDNVKDFLGPLRYVNAPWRYIGVILSPKGSTEKMRIIENGSRVDAGLTRESPLTINEVWAVGDVHLCAYVGPNDELFGLDEHRQGPPHYQDGYLPILQVGYKAEGTTYKEEFLAHPLITQYRSPYFDEPGIAVYMRVTAKDGPGEVAFKVEAPKVAHGSSQLVPFGFRHDTWTDAQNNDLAWFSPGGFYDSGKDLIRFKLGNGGSVYAVFPQHLQLAGTQVEADASTFDKARANVAAAWQRELSGGGRVQVPEKVVMDAYRSLFIGDWQVSIGDELPYGMFSAYEGNAYAEILETIAPFVEFGYFDDARRFIQPILEYPLSGAGIGLHICANQLELAACYYAMSGDSAFIRKNEKRLQQVADYFLSHRQRDTGLVLDGYANDLATKRVVNLNTNSNGWRAIRDLGLTLNAIGERELGSKYLGVAKTFGEEVRQAVLKNIDRSTDPPFVPFALGEEKPYASLVESMASSYYNIVMPYFFESEIFAPKAEPYTYVLEYMWRKQGVMAGLQRCDQHSATFSQDGIHPLYTWGRQFSQICRHEAKRVVYTFYCTLAHAYSRGTFLSGECQGTVPSETEWQRDTYLPPEPPANALLLRSLRHMLLHENDRNQDGEYQDLWLLSSTPKGWLANGRSISFENMPSRFGRVSLKIESALNKGKLTGEATLPAGIEGKQVLLFLRFPEGHRVVQTSLENGLALKLSEQDGDAVVTLPAQPGTIHFSAQVQ